MASADALGAKVSNAKTKIRLNSVVRYQCVEQDGARAKSTRRATYAGRQGSMHRLQEEGHEDVLVPAGLPLLVASSELDPEATALDDDGMMAAWLSALASSKAPRPPPPMPTLLEGEEEEEEENPSSEEEDPSAEEEEPRAPPARRAQAAKRAANGPAGTAPPKKSSASEKELRLQRVRLAALQHRPMPRPPWTPSCRDQH